MYAVTDAYNAAMEKTVRNKSWIKIQFGIVDPDATAAATLTNNGALSYDNTQGTIVGATSPATYATLEHNRWILDGKNPIPVTDNPVYQGYVGNLISGADCTWSTNPQIIVNFSDYFQFAALSFMFDQSMNEYPSEFKISGYHDGDLVYEAIDYPNNTYWIHSHQIPICNKLIFTWVKSALPYRRARMTSLIFGFGQNITQSEMESCTASKSFDIQSTAFPKNNFDLTLIDTTKSYDPENPNGVWEYLESRQPIDVSIGYSLDDDTIEWIPWIHAYTSGDFTVSGSDAYTLVTIKGVGLIEHLTMIYNSSKYYENGRSLYDMVYDVINASGYSNVIEVDQSLRNIVTRVPLPSGRANDLLQLIANAGCCVMNHTRGGVLQIYPESGNAENFDMDFSKMTSKPQTAKTPPLRYLSTKYHPVSVENVISNAISEQEVRVNGGGGVYAITNLVLNGSFENGTTGWTVDSRTVEVTSELFMHGSHCLKITGVVSNDWIPSNQFTLYSGHKYYLSAYVRCNVANGSCFGFFTMNGANPVANLNLQLVPSVTNVFTHQSSYYSAAQDYNVSVLIYGNRGSVHDGLIAYWDSIFAVDLTEAFGAGNEPDKAWCDEHLSYFDGTIYISKNSYIANNMLQNGGFETGDFTGWLTNTTTQTYDTVTTENVFNGKYATKAVINANIEPWIVQYFSSDRLNNHIVYFSAMFDVRDSTDSNGKPYLRIGRRKTGNGWINAAALVEIDQTSGYEKVSIYSILTPTTETVAYTFETRNTPNFRGTYYFDNVFAVDLTETFGAGNEPTKEWCDEHLSYFEGTKVIDPTLVPITFNHGAYVNQTVTTNGTMIAGEPEYYVYKTVIPLLGTGTVTVAGNKLLFGEIDYEKKFGDVGEDLNSMENELIDNYEMCANYVDWLANCVQRRNSYKSTDRGYPQIDIGDKITISTNFNQNVPVCVTEQSIKYNGAISGSQAYIITDGEEE